MKYKFKNYHINIKENEKSITVFDLQDQNNCPASYNTKKRGFKKAYETIKILHEAGDCCTFSTIVQVLNEKFGLKMHTWCMMD